MLDFICTFYNYRELEQQVRQFEGSKYNPKYICNWENEEEAMSFAKELGVDLYWLDYNPNKHDGAFGMSCSASSLIEKEYVMYFHADILFKDFSKLEESIEKFIESRKKLGGIPRQWMFDNNGVFLDNKSLPFRSEVFLTSASLYKRIFNFDRIKTYKQKTLDNGHPSMHFEPLIYASSELNGVNFKHDILYLEDPVLMKKLYKDDIMYYNIIFENTQIIRVR